MSKRRLARNRLAAAAAGLVTAPVPRRLATNGPAIRLAAWTAAAVAMTLSVSLATAQTWTLKGPAPSINGQPENIPNRPISGAIEAVVAHPTNPDILWVGTVNGGIFRTDNATNLGPTWTAQTDTQASLSIAALERDPTDGTHNTLVAGVGRTSSFGSSGGNRAGILRTTDGGANWTPLPSMATRNVSGIAARGNVIVAAVNNADSFTCDQVGIWRSTDTGATFTQISNNAIVTGLPCGLSFDLASDPTDNTRLFTSATHGGSAGIYRSTDTGATWTKVSNATMDGFMISPNPSRVEITVGNAGGANANVFAAMCQSGQLVGLFRSGDAGNNWTSLDLPQTTEQGTSYGIHPGGQCGTHLSVVADPTNASVVYIGGDRQPANNENGSPVVQFPNSIGASTFGGRLFRVDAGQSPGSQATPITNCLTALAGCGGSARTANDTAPHADSREMVFDANGDLIQTDDGGVYRHTNPGGTTGDWESVIGNLAAVEQHSMVLDSVSNILVSGNQDNGSTAQQTPASVEWSGFLGGDGGDVVVGLNDPVAGQSTRYASAQTFLAARRLVFDASNVLQSITFPSVTPIGGSPSPTFPFVTPLEVNANDATRLILGAGNGTYESLDRLDSVTRISTAVANNFGRDAIAYGVAGNVNALYFGSGDDVFVRTAAPPTAPVSSDPDVVSTDDIVGVVIDPDNDQTAFAVDSNQVFRTTNAGGAWTDVTGNLQSLNPGTLRSVEYIAMGGDRLVVGANTGVFVATEASGFSTWSLLGTGLPNAPVFELDYDPGTDVLAAGTLGRGTWTLGFGCTPDAFESDDNAGEAKTISPGVTKNHNICPVGDQDWSTFTLTVESSVSLTTSGPAGDTRMWLRDAGQTQIEFDDDDGAGLFSFIDRTCGADPLAPGTYLVEVDEFGDDDEIASYDLDLSTTTCPCPTNRTLSNQTLSGVQLHEAVNSVTLGPALVINGTDIDVNAGSIAFGNGVTIQGSFAAGNTTINCGP